MFQPGLWYRNWSLSSKSWSQVPRGADGGVIYVIGAKSQPVSFYASRLFKYKMCIKYQIRNMFDNFHIFVTKVGGWSQCWIQISPHPWLKPFPKLYWMGAFLHNGKNIIFSTLGISLRFLWDPPRGRDPGKTQHLVDESKFEKISRRCWRWWINMYANDKVQAMQIANTIVEMSWWNDKWFCDEDRNHFMYRCGDAM